MIGDRQRNPLVFETILIENSIIEIQEQKQALIKQLEDLKDLLRKYRQKQIPISSSYTLANGTFLKRNQKCLYPSLEKTYAKMMQQKNNLNQQLIRQMRKIVKMIKNQLIGKTQLDSRVFALLNHYETNFEEQLLEQ